MALMVVVFWSSTATLAGQRPGSVAANLLLSVLLTGVALRALSRPPSPRGLCLMVTATAALLLLSRALAVPGSPFLENYAALVIPVGTAWAMWSARSCCRSRCWWSSWLRGPGILVRSSPPK
jgi:hypothetical protein